ncbi:hypothetical protein APF79_04695 [bacterium BRH_c32]|nr:MAG: hypothetical protein APF79_04695 [bacterium BRH_c32]
MELVPLVYTALTVVTVLGAVTIIISYISFKVRTKGQPKAKEHTEIIEAERRRAMPERITRMIRKQQKTYKDPSSKKNSSNSRREESRPRREDPRNRREEQPPHRDQSDRISENLKSRRDDNLERRSNSSNRSQEPPKRRNVDPNLREESNRSNNENNYRNDRRNLPPSPPPQRKEFYEERPNESRIRIIKQLKPEDGTTQERNSESIKPPTPNNNKEKSHSKESKKYQSLGDDVIKKYDGEDDDEFFTLDTDEKK